MEILPLLKVLITQVNSKKLPINLDLAQDSSSNDKISPIDIRRKGKKTQHRVIRSLN